jgi:hypothetical protein
VAATHVPSLGPAPEHRILDGARRTSLVVLGIWAAARLAETGFALWVRHSASSPPRE